MHFVGKHALKRQAVARWLPALTALSRRSVQGEGLNPANLMHYFHSWSLAIDAFLLLSKAPLENLERPF